jgi:prolipoprotein diacylglyceryltransferase
MLFALFFAGYSAGRFFISFVRQEQNTYVLGFNEAQLVALAIMLVTVPLLIYRARLVRPERGRRERAPAETEES